MLVVGVVFHILVLIKCLVQAISLSVFNYLEQRRQILFYVSVKKNITDIYNGQYAWFVLCSSFLFPVFNQMNEINLLVGGV